MTTTLSVKSCFRGSFIIFFPPYTWNPKRDTSALFRAGENVTARLHMKSVAVGQANFSGDIGGNCHFEHDLILLIMPLAFNGSHRGNPFCFRIPKPSGGFGCNGQLPYDRSGFLPLAVPSIGRNDIHTIVQKEDHYASKTRWNNALVIKEAHRTARHHHCISVFFLRHDSL